MPPTDPHDYDLALSAVELDMLGRMADAAEAGARDVAALRLEEANHRARIEAALTGCETLLRRVQEREGERLGEAAAGRSALWRMLAQPWVPPIITAIVLGWAVIHGYVTPAGPLSPAIPVPGVTP